MVEGLDLGISFPPGRLGSGKAPAGEALVRMSPEGRSL